MGIKSYKRYILVNKASGKALDWNTSAAAQLSGDHPRIFVYQPVHHAHNHQWMIEKQSNGHYLIKTSDGKLALDGNVNVPQADASHPAPFLYTPVPSAPNHRWRFEKVGKATYVIINEATGLALDGNVDAVHHHDGNLKTPFFYTPVHSAPNHQWELVKAPFGQAHNQKVVIVNKANGKALDWNTGAAAQFSGDHPRVFFYEPVKHAPNHHWILERYSNGNIVIKTGDGNKALDGNVNAPQADASHPAPFLYTPVPDAPNHRWRFEKVGKNAYVIINEATGLALDGNVDAVHQHDSNLKTPFFYTPVHSAPNHQWELKGAQF